MNVRQMLVSDRQVKVKCPYPMKAESYTVHNTYNDASANNEVSYMIRNSNQVSFHYAIDDIEAVQGIPEDRNAWAAGDGGTGKGNRSSIHIEICYSKSGGEKYRKAEKNAIKFIAQGLKAKGWGIDRVKKHQDWSGKNCPHRILDEGRWNSFLAEIEKELKGKPVEKVSNAPKGNTKTDSIVDYLKSIGQDASFANRSRLALEYGISGYTGTANQNLLLLEKMRKGLKVEKPKPQKKFTSIVDYLKHIGIDSSFANRSRLAKHYGISNYKGTANQNTELLNKMQN